MALAGLCVGSASAQEVQSAHTDVDFDQCSLITSDEMGGTFACGDSMPRVMGTFEAFDLE